MKTILLCIWISISTLSLAQFNDLDYFESKTLRIDFTLSGNATVTRAAIHQFIEEPYWGGRTTQLDSCLRLGDFLLLVQYQGQTIYEEGFATLFEEWQKTKEAQTLTRSFPNTCLMPFPKKPCNIHIIKRENLHFTDTLLSYHLDPLHPIIRKSTPPSFKVDTIRKKKAAHQAVDIAILAEGFEANEMKEFRKLSKALSKTLLTAKVFKQNKNRINFYGVESYSEESGTDHPTKQIWKNTCFDASFNTLYSERYLMAQNTWAIRNAASLVPYDHIYIIVNTPQYGGGGIYNYYAICSAYGQSNKEVLIHEFGHSFAALADEYYYDDEILLNYIDTCQEPWQKNITTLVDFDQKWKHLLPKNTPIPTPAHQGAQFPLGVYEGAAYVSKGIYRACPDCRMKTNEADDFCPICSSAIQEVIDFLCGE